MNLTVPREDRFFVYSVTQDSLTAGKPAVIQLDGDSFFECTSLHFHSGKSYANAFEFDNYTLNITELGSAAQGFFNTPIMPGLVFSKACNAKKLRTPFVLAPNTMLQFTLAAAPSGPPLGNNDVFDIALWGVKRYQMSQEEYSQRRQRPYFAYASPLLLQANIPSSQIIQIATDADFVVQNLCSYGDLGATVGGTTDFRAATIQVTDESTQKQLFENPMPWSQIASQAGIFRGNNRLYSPLIFRRNSVIRIDFGGTVTSAFDIQFGFEGYKIKD